MNIDERIKNDHYFDAAAFFDNDPSCEHEARNPITSYHQAVSHIFTRGKRKEGFAKLGRVTIQPFAFAIAPIIYQVGALIGHLFHILIRPTLLLYHFGCNKNGLKNACIAILTSITDLFTNLNQIIRLSIRAILILGILLNYAYDFAIVLILRFPPILFLAQKVESCIKTVKSPILNDHVEQEYIACGTHRSIYLSEPSTNYAYNDFDQRGRVADFIRRDLSYHPLMATLLAHTCLEYFDKVRV